MIDTLLLERMLGLGRDAATLADEEHLTASDRSAYRAAIEQLGHALRRRYPTVDDLAAAFYLSHEELLRDASAECRAVSPGRLSPTVVLNAAVFELAQELGGARS